MELNDSPAGYVTFVLVRQSVKLPPDHLHGRDALALAARGAAIIHRVRARIAARLSSTRCYVHAMKVWIRRRGLLLGRFALAAVIVALAAPFVTLLVGIPFLFGGVPYPPVNPMHVALTVSAVCAVLGLAAGLAVWIARAPGDHLGKAAVIVLTAIVVVFGSILFGGYMLSVTHSEVGASPASWVHRHTG